jgi:SAM-dependent methyltransferase
MKKSIDQDKPAHSCVEDLRNQEMLVDYRKKKPRASWNGTEDAAKRYEVLHQYRFARDFVEGKKVLNLTNGGDIGSSMLAEVAQEVINIDLSGTALDRASSTFTVGDLGFPEDSTRSFLIDREKIFDVIVCFDTLGRVKEYELLIREAKRLLNTGGVFITSTPYRDMFSDIPRDQLPGHLKELYIAEFAQQLSNQFRNVCLYGQKMYPCSNIFPVREEAKSSVESLIEERNGEFCFLSSKKKPTGHLIGVASDHPLIDEPSLRNSYLIDLSETLFKQKDGQISYLQSLLRKSRRAFHDQISYLRWKMVENDTALEQIYNSRGWKILQVFYRLKYNAFPLNSKRRLIAKLALKALTDPGNVLPRLNKINLKKFFHYFWVVEPSLLEKKVERETLKSSKESAKGESPEKSNKSCEESSGFPRAAFHAELETVKECGKRGDNVAKANCPRVIAFYLPQFHPIPENDCWWGKGFTDWANVVRAKPNFAGHYQPHLPSDLGFYDLRVPEVREQQAELARQNGIYGFCYHHYWFNGRRLLERPFNEVLKTGRPNFPFCLCWANENWTRRWDGAEQEVLIAQSHSRGDDIAFIRDLMPAFRDDRYIRINGRPLLVVYRVNILPKPSETAEIWREECRAGGVGEVYLCAAQTFDIADPRPFGFDGAVEFPPHGLFLWHTKEKVRTSNPDFAGLIHDYEDVIRFARKKTPPPYTLFRTVMPSWDNTARKQNNGTIFLNSAPELYQGWLTFSIEYANKYLKGDERLVFINAWNEWGEGCHLEPDKKFGDQYLKATQAVLKKFKTLS